MVSKDGEPRWLFSQCLCTKARRFMSQVEREVEMEFVLRGKNNLKTLTGRKKTDKEKTLLRERE